MVLLRFNSDKKEWVEIPKEEKQDGDLYLDRKEKKYLDKFKERQNKNNDCVIIIEGNEGSGKSAKCGNILQYISNGEFDPKKHLIGADYLDGLTKIENAPVGGYLGFDEGNSFFLATETITREHRGFHKIFSIFRQKRLFVVICLPSFFRLGTYFALDRSIAMIRTYTKKGDRGYFAFYNRKAKNKLFKEGKKDYNPNAVKPTFRGRFTKCLKLENKDYINFKRVTLSSEIDKIKDKMKPEKSEYQIELEVKKKIVRSNPNYSKAELSRILGLSRPTVATVMGKKEYVNAC